MKDYFRVKDPAVNINNSLPVARPGLVFIIIAVLAFVLSLPVGCPWFSLILMAVAAFVVWFFRDPDRQVPDEGFALAPADGRILKVEDVDDNPYTKAPARKVSIFMNVFNVHVNRAPLDGRLISQTYYPGKFFNASFDKASLDNERNALVLETAYGRVAMVQIAGLVARRIVSWVKDGDLLARGQRYGMIRFGSRVDLYLPPEAEVVVEVGQVTLGGLTPLWRLPAPGAEKSGAEKGA